MTTTAPETETTVSVEIKAEAIRNALTAALLCADKGAAALPVLAAVHIRRTADALEVTGTNRYHLVRATVRLEEAGPEWAVLLTRADAERIVKTLPKSTRSFAQVVWLEHTDDGLTVRTYDGATTVKGLDNEFPRVDSILDPPNAPSADGVTGVGFTPEYMAAFCKMPGRSRNGAARLEFTQPNKPLRSEWEDWDHPTVSYRYVLMPTRS